MRRDIATKLMAKAIDAARIFSNPDREFNQTHETFDVERCIPTSESTAVVYFKKNTGKIALAFFYYCKNRWCYFFPTDSHILGMRYVEEHKKAIEEANIKISLNE